MESRTQKQILVGFVILLAAGLASWGIVDYFFVEEATCFDRVQNGREEGVDCGMIACGVACEPELQAINVISEKLITVQPGDYDFVAQVSNPNSNYGSSMVRYELLLTRSDGTTATRTGSFYILPGQLRYVIVQGLRESAGLVGADLRITQANWERLTFSTQLSFPIQRRSYLVPEQPNLYSEFEAVILNSTDYDFDRVEVGVILFDGIGNIVGVGRTDIRTFLSRTERNFRVFWPAPLSSEVVRQDVEVLTNVFENLNFIRNYGTQERFQEYY